MRRAVALLLGLLFVVPALTLAYSVLALEAIIDVVWDTNIRPMLLKRFPNAITFRTPTPEAERLFKSSFNKAVDRYRLLLNEVDDGHLGLPNDNFDVGGVTLRGQYKLNDKACDELLHRLSQQQIAGIDQNLKTQLLAFYAEKDAAQHPQKLGRSAEKIQQEIKALQEAPVTSAESVQPPSLSSFNSFQFPVF